MSETKLEKRIILPSEEDKNDGYVTINGLVFYVKDYQRSYKWEDRQVKMLLNDLYKFKDQVYDEVKKSIVNKKYCMQPLVVKPVRSTFDYKYNISELASGDVGVGSNGVRNKNLLCDSWEVIDGQQRLTTIWLILDVCREIINVNVPMPFDIYYEQSRRMDIYYINRARKTIHEWLKSIQGDLVDNAHGLRKKILSQVMFIWYEVAEGADSVAIFTRLNIGKIPLTDAELFKAMLLNKDTQSVADVSRIAYEWDKIEQELWDDDFWYFISNEQINDTTRIDFLLSLYARRLKGGDEKFNAQNIMIGDEIRESDPQFAFLCISECVEKYKMTSGGIWEKIVHIYEVLKGWYQQTELYHNVGFLIKENKKKNASYQIINNLMKLTNGKKQSEIKSIVMSEVRKLFKNIVIDDLNYNDDGDKIEKVLLYFNLHTMIKSKSGFRFSFRNFKVKGEKDGNKDKNIWQIEHIHARATDEELKTKKSDERKKLLEGLCGELQRINGTDEKKHIKNIKNFIDKKLDCTPGEFLTFYNKIINFYGDVERDRIGNLTLLDSETNESYHNDLFYSKRTKIIERDKEEQFIPVCTKNVFLKAYSSSVGLVNMLRWTKRDAEDYTDAIKHALIEEAKVCQ